MQDVGVAVRRKRKEQELRRRLAQEQGRKGDDVLREQAEALAAEQLGDALADLTLFGDPLGAQGIGAEGDLGLPAAGEAAPSADAGRELPGDHLLDPVGAGASGAHVPFRERLEEALGLDLGFLQVEQGPEAREVADQLGAYAATIDGTVYTPAGSDLFTVAHEVAHALQQNLGMGPVEDVAASEAHADAVARAVVSGQDASSLLSAPSAAGPTSFGAPSGAGPVAGASVVALKENPGAGAGPVAGAEALQPELAEQPEVESEEALTSAGPPQTQEGGGPQQPPGGGEDGQPEAKGLDTADDVGDPALPPPPDLSGGGAGGGGGDAGAPPSASLPKGAGVKAPQVTAAFQSMTPTQESAAYKDMGTALDDASQTAKSETDEATPDLHATLVAEDNLPPPPAIELNTATTADDGAVDEARNDKEPEHDEGLAPETGRSPFRPSAIDSFFKAQEGKDAKQAGKVAVTQAQAGGDGIPTAAVAPELTLDGKADPKQADDGAASAQDEAKVAHADATKAVAEGPGPEVVQLKEMDEVFEAPEVKLPDAPDFATEVAGMDQYQEWSLPGDVQAEFDKQHGALLQGHVAEADAKVNDAQGEFDTGRDDEIASVEAQVAEAQQTAQSEQEKAVSEARADIQSERQHAIDEQNKAVADLNKQVSSERQAVLSDIDQRVKSDQGKVDKAMVDAQKEADAEVAKGQKQADAKAKEAEEEDDGFWGGLWDAIGDAISAITDAIVAVWDAVRDAVNAILDAAVELANKVIDAAISFVSEALGEFLDFLTEMVGALLDDIFPELAAYLKEKLQEFKTWAQEKLEELGNWLKEQVAAFVEGLKAALNALMDALIGALKFASAFLEALVTGDWDKVLAMTIDAIFAIAGIDRAEFEEKYGSAEVIFKSIIEDPGKLVTNAINSLSLGFEQFGDHFFDHLFAGAVEWLSGATGVQVPAKFDLAGIFSLLAQVMGLTKDNLKGIVQKHAGDKAAAVFDFAWDTVSALVEGGWEGLWEHIQGELSGLWDMVLEQVTAWIMEKALARMAQFIATMATGFGAIVEAVIGLWNFGTWLYDNIQKIMSVVRTVLGSIIDFVAGNIQPAADKIESTLAGLIPVVLDLIAKMLGLGDIGKKVRGIIEKLQSKVLGAVDKFVGKVIGKFKGGKDKDKDKEKSDFDGEVGETVQFSASGEGHKIWVMLQGKKPVVMVASTPMTVEERIADWDTRLQKVGDDNGGLAEGYTKGQVAGLLQSAAKLAGVTVSEATETVAALEKEKSGKADAAASGVDKADAETEKAELDLCAVIKKLFEAFGEVEGENALKTDADYMALPGWTDFQKNIAAFGIPEAALPGWKLAMDQLVKNKTEFEAIKGDKAKLLNWVDADPTRVGYQKMVDLLLEKAPLDPSKEYALWSGKPSEEFANGAGAEVLESSVLGKAFNNVKLVVNEWDVQKTLWRAISNAYAKEIGRIMVGRQIGVYHRKQGEIFEQVESKAIAKLAGELKIEPAYEFHPLVVEGAFGHDSTYEPAPHNPMWRERLLAAAGGDADAAKAAAEAQGVRIFDYTAVAPLSSLKDRGPKNDYGASNGVHAAHNADVLKRCEAAEESLKAGGGGPVVIPAVTRKTPDGDKTTKIEATGSGEAEILTEASPMEPVEKKKTGIIGWIKQQGEKIAKEIADTASSLLVQADQAAKNAVKIYKDVSKAVGDQRDKLIVNVTKAVNTVADHMKEALIVIGAVKSDQHKSVEEILADAEDLNQWGKLLGESVRKQGVPVTTEQLDDSAKGALLAKGRELWTNKEGSPLKWMDDAVGAVGAGVSKKWKALKTNALEVANKDFTGKNLDDFAKAMASAYRTAAAGKGTFVAVFDAEVQAAGLEKYTNPKVNDEWTIKFGKFEHKVTPEGSEGEIPLGIGGSDGIELQKLLDPSVDIPLPGYPFVWLQLGNEEKELLADGAKIKYKHSRKEDDKSIVHDFGGGGIYKGKLYEGKIFGAVHLGLPKMSLLKVALEGVASAEGEASGTIGLRRTVSKDSGKASTELMNGEINLKAELKGTIQLTVKVLEFIDKLVEKYKTLASIVEAIKPEGEIDKKRGGLLGKLTAKMDGLKMPELNLQLIGGSLGEITWNLKAEKIKDDTTTAWKWSTGLPKFKSNVKQIMAEAFKSQGAVDGMKEAAQAADALAAEVDDLRNKAILAEKAAENAEGDEKKADKDVKKAEAEKAKAEEPLKKAEQAEQDALDAEKRANAAVEEAEELAALLAAAKKDPTIAAEFGYTMTDLQKMADLTADLAFQATMEAAQAKSAAELAKSNAKGAPEAVKKAEAKIAEAKKKAEEAKQKAKEARDKAIKAKDDLKAKEKEIKSKNNDKDAGDDTPEEQKKLNINKMQAGVEGKGEKHTAKVHDNGKNFMHSTPRPVSAVLADASGKFAAAKGQGPAVQEVAKSGEALVAQASALNAAVEGQAKSVVGAADPKAQEKAANEGSKQQSKLSVVLGKILDAVKAIVDNPEAAKAVKDASGAALKAGDVLASPAPGADKAGAVAGGVGAAGKAVQAGAPVVGGLVGKDGSKVAAGGKAVAEAAAGGEAVAAAMGKAQGATGADKVKAVSEAVGAGSKAVGAAGATVAKDVLGDEALAGKIAAGGGAGADLAGGVGGVADAVGAYKKAGATKVDKAKAVASGVGAAGAAVGAAGDKIAGGVLGNEKLGKQIAAGGGAVADLAGGASGVADAVGGFTKEGASKVDKAKAVASGVGAAGAAVGAAGEKVAGGVLGNEKLGKQIAAGGGAVADLAGGASGVADAVGGFTKEGASKVDKAKAVASGVKAAGAGIGAAGDKVAGGVLGNEKLGKQIAAGGGAVADLAGGASGVADAVGGFTKEGASKVDKAKAVASGVGAAGAAVGAAGEKVAGGVLGNEKLGKQIAAGGGAVADLAGGASGVADAVGGFTKEGASKVDKAKAVASGVKAAGSGVGAAGQKIAGGVLGNEKLGKQIAAGGGAAVDLAGGASGVADAVGAYTKEGATKADKVKAVASGVGAAGTAVAGAGGKIAGDILGNEKLGKQIGLGGGAAKDVADVVSAGTDAVTALGDDKLSKTKKANAVLSATESLGNAGGSAGNKIAQLAGNEALGGHIEAGGKALAGVAGAGKDVTAAVDVFGDANAKTVDKVAATTKAVGSVGKAGANAVQTGLNIAGNADLAKKVGQGSEVLGAGVDGVTAVTGAVKVFQDDKATGLDKAKAVHGAAGGVLNAGVKGAKAVGELTGNKAVGEIAGKVGDVGGKGLGVVGSGLKAYEDGTEAVNAFKKGDYVEAGKRSLGAVGHTAQGVKQGADLVSAVAGSDVVKSVAGKVGGVAGSIGAGAVGAVSAVDNAANTIKDAKAAASLSDKSALGQKTKGQVSAKAKGLADKYGISTDQPGWEKAVEAEHNKRKQAAMAKGEEAFKQFSTDGDVQAFESAKKVDDLRSYAKGQKVAGAVVKGVDTAGDIASTVGTFTAGADGGATKTAGAVLKGGAMAARVGKAAYDRGENVSAHVDAQDIMKGYDKQGVIGKGLDKAGAAISQAGQAVANSAPVQGVVKAGKYVAGKAQQAGAYVGEKAAAAGGYVKDKAVAAGGYVADKAKAAGGYVADKAAAAGGYVADKAKAAGGYVKDKAVAAGGYVADKAKAAGGYVADKAAVVGGVVKDKAQALANTTVGKAVVGTVGAAANGVKAAGGYVADKAKAAGGYVADKAAAAGGYVADKARAAAAVIGGKAGEAGGKIAGMSKAAWSKTKEVAGQATDKLKAAAQPVVDKAKAAGASVVKHSKAAAGYVAEKATQLKGKVKEAAAPVLLRVTEIAGKGASAVKKAGGYVADKAKAAGGYVADKAAAAGAWAKDKAQPMVDKAKAAGGYVADKAKAAGGYVADKAKAAGGYVADKAKVAGGYVADKAKAVGNKAAALGGKAWDGTKSLAGKAGSAIANSAVGKAAGWVGGKVGDAGSWLNENIWQTSDMKWARKAAAFVTPRSSDKMLAETQEQFANNDKAKLLKDKDYAKYADVEQRLGGNTQQRNVSELVKIGTGKSGSPEDIANAKEIMETLGVDVSSPDAEAKLKAALAW